MNTTLRTHAGAAVESGTLSGDAAHPAGSRRALLARSFARSIRWIVSWQRRRRAIHELMALDDHMLADIGLSRGAVMYAALRGGLPRRERGA